ncbi:ACP S-malonyltransferase [Alkaliphilus peptidifermentans]|nr:ACP S-malonyltransferase [Alkaliphilus peptidifermentans]
MNRYLAAFPGREAFYKGLSKTFIKEYTVAKKIFKEASDYMGQDLEYISYENPETKPELHTACLITHCYAMYNSIVKTIAPPTAVAGFSQGEFTALTVAESIKFPDVLNLVYRLEKLVYRSKEIMGGKMVRVVGLDIKELEKCCRQVDNKRQKVSVAIYLSNNQNIISGEKTAVEEVADLSKKRGARWTIDLESVGTFHSPLCEGILCESDLIFDQYEFSDSILPVYSCVDGRRHVKGEALKSNLRIQIAKAVRWNRIIENANEDKIKNIVEIGPGCTVSGNSRLADPDIQCTWINETKTIKDLLK